MGKLGPVFIIASASIILLSFGVLCYLMRTINPKPAPEQYIRHSPTLSPFIRRFLSTSYLNESMKNSSINDTNSQKLSLEKDTFEKSTHFPKWQVNNRVFSILAAKEENETDVNISPLPIKGHRRAVKEDDLWNQEENNILLVNIVDEDNIPKIIIKVLGKDITTINKNLSLKGITGDIKQVIEIEINGSPELNIAQEEHTEDFDGVKGNSINHNFELAHKTSIDTHVPHNSANITNVISEDHLDNATFIELFNNKNNINDTSSDTERYNYSTINPEKDPTNLSHQENSLKDILILESQITHPELSEASSNEVLLGTLHHNTVTVNEE